LLGEAVKRLLSKLIRKDSGLARYNMPAFKEDFIVGRGADRIEREAYEKGYATGEKAGFDMGEKKAKVLFDKLDALLADVATMRQQIVKEMETQFVELAVSIARKIIVKELTVQPAEIIKMTKEGLLKLERTGQITIKVNPTLYDFFMKHKPDLTRIHPDIVIDVDPSVSPFGTVVMGPVEDVVTDLDEQLKNLIKDLGAQHGQK
jgi:flagellar biosynthesis/type III secretory pathway protein FliH